MQNTKDTFYVTLRERLATVNTNRTVLLRGVTRPGILVEENELPAATVLPDVFVLRWTEVSAEDAQGRHVVRCEIRYATEGSADVGSMDRGRALTRMDEELVAMLAPQWAVKQSFATTPATTMGTRIFWSAPVLAVVQEIGNALLQRSVTVDVYGYKEAGEQ